MVKYDKGPERFSLKHFECKMSVRQSNIGARKVGDINFGVLDIQMINKE